MKLIGVVDYKNMLFYYHTHFYDIPLVGLCFYLGSLCYFHIKSDSDYMYEIFDLTFWEKLKYKYKKKLFEICIGYHCTYPHRTKGVHFYYKRPKWFWKIVFNVYYHKDL